MPGLNRLDPEVAAAVVRAWQVPTDTATAKWVVGLFPGQDPQAVFGSAPRATPTPYVPDTFVVEFDTPVAAAGAADQFPGAAFFYPLVPVAFSKKFVPNDPRFKNEWHLRNTGQTGGTPGVDARVVPVWDNFTGAGVTIGIVDDGLQHSHPDLQPNYDAADSFDYQDGDADPDPASTDGHGTAVAGVAAAKGNNGIGVAGAAFNASLAGLRLLGPKDFTDQDSADALSYHRNSIDIYSNSWGPPDIGTLGSIGPLTLAALKSDMTMGRNGLGNIYTWAAGNGLGEEDNVNYDAFANERFVIAVGAISHTGRQASYSEPGAPMLVTSYSASYWPGETAPGLTTTDLNGGYQSDFNGTSAATPVVSGVIALMLQANPNLTARDVQNILVRTARKTDAADPGWSTNKAGFHINHKYGFGAIDARAAVALAQNWVPVRAEVQVQGPLVSVRKPIPDGSAAGVTSTVSISRNIQVEHVEVVFDATHPRAEDLDVVLTAPSGTRSVLAQTHIPFGTFGNYSKWVFSTVRDWGEQSAGNWTLTVRDKANGQSGTFNDWQLLVYGTEGLPPTLSGIEGTAAVALEGRPARLSTTVAVSDPNSTNLSRARVSISANFQPGQDTLSFTPTGPITGTFDPGAGVLSLSGAGTLAQYQSALRSVKYLNTSNNPTGPARTVSFQVVDDTDVSSNVVSRTLIVVPVNDPPSFSAGGDVTVFEDSRQYRQAWATNISPGTDETGQTVSFETVSNDNPALFSSPPFVTPDGTLNFTPAPDANGSATIAVRAHDDGGTANFGQDTSAAQTFAITVLPVNDPATARDDAYSVLEDGSLTVPAPGILANDRDPEGDTMTAQLLNAPAHGALSFTINGAFSYTPLANFAGNDSFTYRVRENGGGLLSAPATVALHVIAQNDLPTANDDSAASDGHPVTINVLGNDTDPDGDVLRVGSYTRPTMGRVSRLGNSLVYTPLPGATGNDIFTYTAVDAGGATSTATVTVNVTDAIAPEVRSVRVTYGTGGTAVADFGSLARSVLPWANITSFQFTFSEDVDPTALGAALSLAGAFGGDVPLTFSYNAATRTGTWSVAAGLGIDRYALRLSATGVRDGSGNTLGGDWAKAFALLTGDYDGNGIVDEADQAGIQANFTRPGMSVNRWADVNGDGLVDAADVTAAAQNSGRRV